ncbi:MAG: hypothetical protein ABSC46_12710 [Candidatus Limnocylindrales bacterium]
MGARTDAARAEVVASRQLLLDEVAGLEAAGRSAIDIPAKIRRSPAKVAALAAGTAFIVLGGPKRTYRAIRRAVLGPKADLPKSMLPEQIDKALHSLGDDGNRVRGLLEREFVDYLEKNKPVREARDLRGTVSELGGNLLRPATAEAGKRLAKELFKPEGGSFHPVMDRIQARREARKSEGAGPTAEAEPKAGGKPASSSGSGRRGIFDRRSVRPS